MDHCTFVVEVAAMNIQFGTVSFETSSLVFSMFRSDSFIGTNDWLSLIYSHLDAHSVLNGVFIGMLSFIVLCHIFPQFIARVQSNPYTIQLPWNFGPNSFNFQLLNYDIYHGDAICRWAHHITIAAEAFLWLLLIRGMLGSLSLSITLTILCIQAFSYRDAMFGSVLASIWTIFAGVSHVIVESDAMESDYLMLLTKKAIFLLVLVRTISHVLEPTPPLVNEDNDKFGAKGFLFAFTNPYRSMLAFIFGDVSEMASGIPGRLFPVLVYYAMSSLGYRSSRLMNIATSQKLGSSIIEDGWSSYHQTASLFAWARNIGNKVIPTA